MKPVIARIAWKLFLELGLEDMVLVYKAVKPFEKDDEAVKKLQKGIIPAHIRPVRFDYGMDRRYNATLMPVFGVLGAFCSVLTVLAAATGWVFKGKANGKYILTQDDGEDGRIIIDSGEVDKHQLLDNIRSGAVTASDGKLSILLQLARASPTMPRRGKHDSDDAGNRASKRRRHGVRFVVLAGRQSHRLDAVSTHVTSMFAQAETRQAQRTLTTCWEKPVLLQTAAVGTGGDGIGDDETAGFRDGVEAEASEVLSEIMAMELVLVVMATIPLDYVEEKVDVAMPAACALVGTMDEGVEKALSMIWKSLVEVVSKDEDEVVALRR
eukprot:jgi/Phyca11/15879/fgenesh1_pg.PHYCAscaffold_16_\